VKGEHVGVGQAIATALIGAAAVDVAVADNPGPACERRADQAFDMIGPRGGKQQRFGPRAPAFALRRKQQGTDRLGAGVPPGSRVSTASIPRAASASARRRAWVDLPAPRRPRTR
jgi:hypothetical protein